jgi:hypothetical protein
MLWYVLLQTLGILFIWWLGIVVGTNWQKLRYERTVSSQARTLPYYSTVSVRKVGEGKVLGTVSTLDSSNTTQPGVVQAKDSTDNGVSTGGFAS